MSICEGLTGLVIERMAPVAVEEASSHPRFKYFPETREERFHSFLGVPLVTRKLPTGVLVVQTVEPRRFTRAEIRTFSTISSQVAGLIEDARLLDSIIKMGRDRDNYLGQLHKLEEEQRVRRGRKQALFIKGIPASPGICIGKAHLVREEFLEEECPPGDPQEELKRFSRAVLLAKKQIRKLQREVAEWLVEEDAAIFNAQLLMLEEEGLIGKISKRIQNGAGAISAVKEIIEVAALSLEKIEDEYLRERGMDVRDVGKRLLMNLAERRRGRKRTAGILVAKDIYPSELFSLDPAMIAGIATAEGGATSHVAILAKSLRIPAVLGAGHDIGMVEMNDDIIVNGYEGVIHVRPGRKIVSAYEEVRAKKEAEGQKLLGIAHEPAETSDGEKISLLANISIVSEIETALRYGAEGVGIYRTEFPFMIRKKFPSEEEQYHLFCRILKHLNGRPLTIRTLDVGGDKLLAYMGESRDPNPYLGLRSTRLMLKRPDVFKIQIRAILRASSHGKVRIMFPMISLLEEVREAKAILDEARRELLSDSMPFDEKIKVGIMVEVPSVVLLIDRFVKEVDFLSIGTNDLIQYIFAADRSNMKVARYMSPFHPAILQQIATVIRSADKACKELSVCGEMAGHPVLSLVLIGLGIKILSMPPENLLRTKANLCKFKLPRLRSIARKALQMETSGEVKNYLAAVLGAHVPDTPV